MANGSTIMGVSHLLGFIILSFLLGAMIARSRKPTIPIWSIMAFTSFLTIAFGLVRLDEVGSIIDWNVVLFLVGMFSIVGLAESSGLFNLMGFWFINHFESRYHLILASSIFFGLLAAISMNDTVAFMGPPLAYTVSRALDIDPRVMFLLLAFSLTIGSVTTPIGNPQNVLIVEESGITAPFYVFFRMLFVPTLINLVITPMILVKLFGVEEKRKSLILIPGESITNKRDAALGALGLVSTVLILIANDLMQLLGLPYVEKRGLIPFFIAAALYIVSSNPRELLGKVDWGTIIFFISMFITMQGVWRSGVFTPLLSMMMPHRMEGPQALASITFSSLLISQVISNVPFASFFTIYMKSLGYTRHDELYWIALAFSSTIAGNLTPLGAASNIIILEYLESRMNTTIILKDFLKAGLIVTAVNTAIYLIWLHFFIMI
ncbi:MAG: SLC13 family permease [Infirmifilum sp.]